MISERLAVRKEMSTPSRSTAIAATMTRIPASVTASRGAPVGAAELLQHRADGPTGGAGDVAADAEHEQDRDEAGDVGEGAAEGLADGGEAEQIGGAHQGHQEDGDVDQRGDGLGGGHPLVEGL